MAGRLDVMMVGAMLGLEGGAVDTVIRKVGDRVKDNVNLRLTVKPSLSNYLLITYRSIYSETYLSNQLHGDH